jgi:hypothetical protein
MRTIYKRSNPTVFSVATSEPQGDSCLEKSSPTNKISMNTGNNLGVHTNPTSNPKNGENEINNNLYLVQFTRYQSSRNRLIIAWLAVQD